MSGTSTDRFGRVVNTHLAHVHHAGSNERQRKPFFSLPVADLITKQVDILQTKVEQLQAKEKVFQAKLTNLDVYFRRRLELAYKADLVDITSRNEIRYAELKSHLERINSRIAILVVNLQNLDDDFREKIAGANSDIAKISQFIDGLGIEVGPQQIKFGKKTLSDVRNAASDSDAINYFQYKLFTNELHKKIAAQKIDLEQQKNIISSHTDLISRSLVENVADSTAFLAKDRRITAVASPIDPTDATNLLYLQEFVLKQITELEEKINTKIAKKPKRHHE